MWGAVVTYEVMKSGAVRAHPMYFCRQFVKSVMPLTAMIFYGTIMGELTEYHQSLVIAMRDCIVINSCMKAEE